jgi:putative transcriptional regulator
MTRAGERIVKSARQALAYAGGGPAEGFVVHVPEAVDVKAIRERFGLSQADFARRFGFRVDAVQNWEQGRRRPAGAARALLKVIDREPEAVRRALAR